MIIGTLFTEAYYLGIFTLTLLFPIVYVLKTKYKRAKILKLPDNIFKNNKHSDLEDEFKEFLEKKSIK